MSRRFKIRLSKLKHQARHKPEGYYDDVVSRGDVEGEWLMIEAREYTALLKHYATPGGVAVMGGCGNCVKANGRDSRRLRGIGDVIERVLAKLGFRSCARCKKRRDKLNKWFSFK